MANLIDFGCRLFDSDKGQPDLERWFDQMTGQGPEHIALHAIRTAETAAVVEAAQQHPERFSAFAVCDPAGASEVAQAIASRKLRGALLFPGIHGFRLGDAGLTQVFEACQAKAAPVVIRCGLPPAVLRDQPGVQLDMRAANPLELIPVATRYPEIPFVIQAFGAGFFREALMAGEICENVYLETSGSGAWMRTQSSHLTLEDVLERSLGVFGAERLLFATGSGPALPGWRTDLATLQREAMGALEMAPGDMFQILAGNASRLLGV